MHDAEDCGQAEGSIFNTPHTVHVFVDINV